MPDYAETLIRIAVILAGAVVIVKLAGWLIRRLDRVPVNGDDEAVSIARKKRVQTLTGLLTTVVAVVVGLVAVLMSLSEAGVQVGPLIAAAGIGGIAIGFGAQSLVKDIISGFFILLEGQFDVGDVVEIAGVSGTVDAIALRSTMLRSIDGRRHVVPNGEIRVSTNLTKGFSRYLIDLPLPYEEDVDRAAEVVRAVADDLQADPAYGHRITDPIEILGVDDYADSSVNLRLYFETLPGEQWAVGREFRRRLKMALDAEGIGIPYPHRQIIVRNENGGDPVAAAAAGS